MNGPLGSVMREILTGPSTYLTNGRGIDQIDSSFNSSFHGLSKQPVKLPPRLILRPLAGYLAVTYLTVAFLFLTLIFGKSMLGALLILFSWIIKATTDTGDHIDLVQLLQQQQQLLSGSPNKTVLNVAAGAQTSASPVSAVKLPPRLTLRPLASYLAVTYLTVAFLFLTLIFGKSMLGALLILFILFAFGVVVKAFVNPTTEIKTGHNDTTSELFLSDMLSK
jgi:hypothetical protein